ncbi:glycosyltransferase [Pedobacter sp. JY14-1]|uniref:glycosyltransferase n=1 Tax=Pedobacter sp. JY14-1 TaxID=3034151 RepID=UPI0023E0E05E|nr:glycosyltransferase [Pedobacter sp. JY14-1]
MNSYTKPLISVVFTSYNHIKYLRQAIESIIQQDYENLEVIVVDDCSNDGSQEVLREYESYSNVTLKLNDVNSGSYVNASNYGATFAKGDYILFAQCDDYAKPDQLSKLIVPFLTNPSVGVVYSRSNLVDENGIHISDDYEVREKKFRSMCKNDCLINKDDMLEFLSFSCVVPNLSAALIRQDVFKRAGGLSKDYLVAADWALWLEISENYNFYYLSESLNYFRQHATTIRSSVKIKVHLIEIYTIFYNHIAKYNLTGNKRRWLREGAGAICFWYFYTDKKQWLLAFRDIYNYVIKKDKSVVWFFIMGSIKQLKEALIRKIG